MNYTYNKLRGRIVEKYGTQAAFSEAIGLSDRTVSLKMCGHVGFSQDDIVRWSGLLGIETSEIPEFFFA